MVEKKRKKGLGRGLSTLLAETNADDEKSFLATQPIDLYLPIEKIIPNFNQPSQKFFESKLFYQLKQLNLKKEVFLEAESSKIGNIHIPKTIWAKMIVSPRIEIKADIQLRSTFLVKDYEYMWVGV